MKKLLALAFMAMLAGWGYAQSMLISEILANPTGVDSAKEFIEIRVLEPVNFSVTPYSVIWTNNGTATADGWIEGFGITYAFEINSGSVTTGDVVYVGGSQMNVTGTRIKQITTWNTAGDGGIGAFNASGVFGNGGINCDGVAIFNLPIASITASSVPVDAIFFGIGTGTAVVSGGAAGYQLPFNDKYAGGKLQPTSFIAPDPASGIFLYATGEYDTLVNGFITSRTWNTGTTFTDDSSEIVLSGGVPITPSIRFLSITKQANEDSSMVHIGLAIDNRSGNSDVTLNLVNYGTLTGADVGSSVVPVSWTSSTPDTQYVTLSIVDDPTSENDEWGVWAIRPVTNAEASTDSVTILYIQDNDRMAPTENLEITLSLLSSFNNGVSGSNSAEISAFDPLTDRLFVVNSIAGKLNIFNYSNPLSPTSVGTIDVFAAGYGGINSVAVQNGIVIVAVEDTNSQDSGYVLLMPSSATTVSKVLRVGAMPDMVWLAGDGSLAITANEGEPNDSLTVDPNGTVSIIDLSAGITGVTQSDVTTLDFSFWNGSENTLRSQGVRIFNGRSTSQDVEPEYITVNEDNSLAYVTLQENNAVAVIDLDVNSILRIVPLGYAYGMDQENAMDVKDNNAPYIHLGNWPVYGAYMPDAIKHMNIGGTNYLFTANEGDAREYTGLTEIGRISGSSFVLDSAAFPYPQVIKSALGRLNATLEFGDSDSDGDFDKLYCFGARSFSIWDADADTLVRNQTMEIENILSKNPIYAPIFNCSNSNNTLKNRSDDKGPEPEGIVVDTLGGHTYAFVGLERIGGVMIFNVDNPADPQLVQYINNRSTISLGGDRGTEGLILVHAGESPTGAPLLILSNEVSATVACYSINIPLGIEDNVRSSSFLVYPNPAIGSAVVTAPGASEVVVFNILGEEMFRTELSAGTGLLDLTQLPAGTYLVRVSVNNEYQVRKLVVE